ncbi:uncharacterized protein LOC143592776 [Bidens hawaiensis]|uniref:uncharacterized protein LOC143592776 n=1 Tax=Bidens hawaiensis TaxID=980011 RepID=UPI00404B9C47
MEDEEEEKREAITATKTDEIRETTSKGALWSITNNEAEYEALLAGLRMVEKVKAKRVKDHVDSLLVANQVGGSYDAKDLKMKKYLKKTHELLKKFENAEVTHIPRSSNKKADALSKLAAVAFDHMAREVKVEILQQL